MGGKDNYEDLTEMNGFSPHDDEKSVRSTKSTESEKETKAVGVTELFKFSDRTDVLFLLVGALAALLGGMMYPLNIYLFGDLTNDFVMSAREDDNSTKSAIIFKELTEKASTKAIYLCILGVSSYILSALQNFFWCYIAERQVRKIRKLLFDSILRQDVSWFDLQKRGELSARYSEDIHKIKEGMGVKVGMFLRLFITFSGVGVIAIILNWKLALAALSFSPVMVVTQAICAKVLRSISETESKAYAGAGAIAEESISAIRTVTAFGGQEKQYTRYSENLNVVEKVVLRKGFLLGLCVSVHWSSMFFLMAVSFWYGTTLFQEGGYRPGDIIMVFFGVLLGSILLGEALPSIEVFATARGAAANVYRIIDLQPSINAYYEKGEQLKDVQGTLQIEGATFRYPSRPEVSVLHGTTFDIPSGQRVALVGASGSGKSTILQLLLRLHDPDKGQILLDGKDIKTLNLKWYRDQIGVVGQEPVLFDTTIADNIRYGRADVTQDEIEAAAKEANAHKFITNLPDKYNTIVGGRGQRLSGGQKQRVAIARALVKNPRFLFLDEATSALDNENEVLVQKALDLAQAGRTTLIIAHRLSTIKNADKIIVLDNGEIKEVGTHSELMENESHYYRLVMKQAAEEDKLENELSNHSISEGIQRMISTASDVKIEKDQDKVKHENHDDGGKVNGIVMRLLKLNSKEWMYIIPGCLASLVTGAVLPSLAFLFSEFLKILAIHDKKSQMDQTKIVAAVDMGIAILLFLAHLIKMLSFVVSGSRLTLRLRKIGFKSILGQDISFFDEPGNQVGNLTTRLSTDASIVHGATGSKIGAILETLTTVTCMLVIAFFYSWKLSLVVFSFFPLILFSGIIQGKFVKGNQSEDAEFIAEAGNVYTQVIDNITTVTSLNAQPQFKKKYDSIVDTLYSKGKKHAITEGITFAFSACIIYFVYAGSLRYGAELVKDGEIEFHNVFRILVVILFGGFAIGREGSYTPDFVKAKVAAQRLFSLIDRVPRIDPYSKSGTIPKTCTGEVDIQNLHFRYPSRPDALILKDMSLNIRTGKTVALVGQSGCGKSTVVQLLERFYDIDSGTISLDQVNITSLNISWLRSQIGVVSQEPVLFDCSIAENIAYGNNSRDVTMAEIIESARSANIHSFIDALPQGYETNVGARGTQLSGGQKQRVAIARVMVRNPKILLLDEATSALDTESEKIVQEAIDRATEGRTCIVIAHRLSTIINADQIAVINNGQIEEVGSHSELIAKQGKYYNLYKLKGNNDVHS